MAGLRRVPIGDGRKKASPTQGPHSAAGEGGVGLGRERRYWAGVKKWGADESFWAAGSKKERREWEKSWACWAEKVWEKKKDFSFSKTVQTHSI